MNDPHSLPVVVEYFHGPGVEAWLWRGAGECRLDLSIENDPQCRAERSAHLEVLRQPISSLTGLPFGAAIVQWKEKVKLWPTLDNARLVGRSRLPGVPPEEARSCYYRVTVEESTKG